jgi:nucleotide-binding universal stress UspA family protein
MIAKTQKKLLLAIDGSEHALDTVRYVAEFAPFHEMRVVLFNIFSDVPEYYWDLELNPHGGTPDENLMASEMQKQQRKTIQNYMDKAKQGLIQSGFPENAVTVKINSRKEGIARDIINEARDEYNAIVIGRKGMGSFKEIVVGSVADKIVTKTTFLPVIVIGEIPPDKNILIAIDTSKNAMRAVDYVATTLGDFDFKIHLLHVIRGEKDFERPTPISFLPKEYLKFVERTINTVFDEAKRRLTNAGFKSDQITTQITTGGSSRAGAIVSEARGRDYGTIVIGRKGFSDVPDFAIGRVSNKVIHLIRNKAVWIVP